MGPSATQAPRLLHVVRQHADECAALRNSRRMLLRAPGIRLHDLARHDERLAAHLDGLEVAAEDGLALAEQALDDDPGAGTVFTAAVLALRARHDALLQRLVGLAADDVAAARGLMSAFGWVEPKHLKGITRSLLDAEGAWPRVLALATCTTHGVLPAATALHWADDAAPALRARALRSLGEAAAAEGLAQCLRRLGDPDCRYQAARAAALLGERARSREALARVAAEPGPLQRPALCMLLRLTPVAESRRLMQPLAQQPQQVRLLIHAIGADGNPHFVPWLIKQTADPALARIAAESISLITGLDLDKRDLCRPPPEPPAVQDDEAEAELDPLGHEDDGLPWPDADKIGAWWHAHGSRFQAGTRYFMGEPLSATHCLQVLRTGFQRQRLAAAEHLCLLQPGTPLFNVAAPAWRQARQLDQMAA